VDTAGWRGTPENLSMLPVVQEAVSRDRKLTIVYWRGGRERAERTVDPLGLVAKGSAWYLVAGTPAGLRTYRVSRIEDAKLLDLPCERPANFDLEEYWKSSTQEFRLVMAVQAAEKNDPDGWVTMQVQFYHEEEALFVVMGLGAVVDVIEPVTLRERVAAATAAVVERMQRASM
jgi:predicted DNA-binding transcriptional regulator YafY